MKDFVCVPVFCCVCFCIAGSLGVERSLHMHLVPVTASDEQRLQLLLNIYTILDDIAMRSVSMSVCVCVCVWGGGGGGGMTECVCWGGGGDCVGVAA